MKAALFGEQVDSFNEAIVYNGQYIISNALIKLIEERWRNNSDELPFQVTFGGQTVVQRVNSEGTIDGPMFQSIQSFSRILMPGTKYDVLGIILFVEDKVRIINANQGREFHVREIVITDQTARFHTQQLLHRQAKVLQVHFAPTDETPIDIYSVGTKKSKVYSTIRFRLSLHFFLLNTLINM